MTSVIGYGQKKAKFKSESVTVQKVRLPIHASSADLRTYDIITKGLYSSSVDPHGKKLYGWTRVDENPNVKAVVSIYGYTIQTPKKTSTKKEKKDKDGKVTDKWTEYSYSNSAIGKASMYVYGVSNPFVYNKKASRDEEEKPMSKYDEKIAAKEEAEKKDLEDNPFLTQETIEEAEESDIGEDKGLEDAELTLVDRSDMDKSISVKTGSHRTSSAAYKEYTDRKRDQLVNYRTEFPDDVYKSSIASLNKMYGFAPVNNKFYLSTMKSEDHPEYKMWGDACQATETILKTFKYNTSIEEKQKQLDPILLYFKAQLDATSADDKKQRKIRRAAFHNITNIMYYLDRHEEVMALCKNYLDDKKLDKFAEQKIEKSKRLQSHLAFHGMNECHIESNEEVDAEDIETEEEILADDDDN